MLCTSMDNTCLADTRPIESFNELSSCLWLVSVTCQHEFGHAAQEVHMAFKGSHINGRVHVV